MPVTCRTTAANIERTDEGSTSKNDGLLLPESGAWRSNRNTKGTTATVRKLKAISTRASNAKGRRNQAGRQADAQSQSHTPVEPAVKSTTHSSDRVDSSSVPPTLSHPFV